MQIYMKDGKALKVGAQFVKPVGQIGEIWVWNESITYYDSFVNFVVEFISNGVIYGGLTFSPNPKQILRYDSTIVYSEIRGWADDGLRTITFTAPPTGDLLNVLQKFATKQ